MKIFLLPAAIVACFVMIQGISSTSSDVPYPDDYRMWAHVKSGMIGPKSNQFAQLGGFYHVYANSAAMTGYKSGIFPNGSVIALERLEMIEQENGAIVEGKKRLVDVMIKDTKYDSTGGWGFEEFLGEGKLNRVVLAQSKSKCFNCHTKRKDHDFVFGEVRK